MAPQLAGVHYPADRGELSELLARSLVLARTSSVEAAKLVIAPPALNGVCGPVAASAFANLANRQGIVRRVVVMGPARHSALRGIAIPTYDAFSTPLGPITLDKDKLSSLRALPQVSVDDRGFEQETTVETLLPLLQACLVRFELTPIIVGHVTPEVVAQVLTRIWGGPETLIVITSDLSQHLPEDKARAYDAETRGLVETHSHDLISTARADGHRLIAGALIRAAQLDLRVTGVDFRTAPISSNRAQGHGAFVFEPATSARLSTAERRYLLRAAAQSMVAAVENPSLPSRPMTTARLPLSLSALRATHVTLEQDGILRGSAGGVRAFRSLLTDVMARAGEAAVADIRFEPLKLHELGALTLSISIVSQLRTVVATSDEEVMGGILPGRDGLVLEERGRFARALPEEWRQIPDPVLFLRALKQRAGLEADYWSPTLTFRKFSTETFSAPLAHLIDA